MTPEYGVTGTAPATFKTPRTIQHHEEPDMIRLIGMAVFASAMVVAGAVMAQGILVDTAADKVIKKFEAATCDQLKAQKHEPPSEKEKIGLDLLRDDPKARVAFIDKIAAPVLNKMFECDIIP
ncbi:hypothetical protein ACVWXO_009500 [Bradyrhizobium sp. LM2.7]